MEYTSARFFVSGGTLQADAPSYIVRRADTALLDALSRGEFCYVLDTRQVGKSSLMIRTATALRQRGYRVAVLDLTAYGQNLSVEQWYYSMLVDLGDQIDMAEELSAFWRQNRELGPLPRLLTALRQVALANSPAPLILFIDEIEAVRSLAFSVDELFAGIRECFNRRTQDAVYSQLTFCLLGVATPAELISDARSTPFNIGRRIELNDFTAAEARPLAAGLVKAGTRRQWVSPSTSALRLLDRVIYWTGGHPYLTQLCCQALAEQPQITTPRGVDRLCRSLFCSHQAQRTDDNLVFVRNRLLQSDGDLAALLDLYGQILTQRGGVRNDEKSAYAAALCLSGIVRLEGGVLRPRNRIYRRVFDRAWIRASMPDAESRRQQDAFRRGLLRAGAIAGTIIMAMSLLVWSEIRAEHRAERERQNARDLLYAADIRSGEQALMEYNPEFLRQLMSAHRHEPWVYEWRYLWKACHRDRVTFVGHTSVVQGIAYAPDGLHVATGSGDKTVRIWQVATGKVVHTLWGHRDDVIAVAYSPDGRWLASGGNDGDVILWDALTGKLVYRRHLSRVIYAVKFSPDGRSLAIGESGRVQVLNALDGQVRWTGETRNREIMTLAFAPDGGELVTASPQRTIQAWETATGRRLYTLGKGAFDLGSLAWSPDGKRLAGTYSLPADCKVHLWDIRSRQEIGSLANDSAAGHIAFAPDGKQLAVANGNNAVTLWNLATGKREPALVGHSADVVALAYSPDGQWLATASWDKTARLWSTRCERHVVLAGIDSNTVCAFSPDSLHLATASLRNPVRLYDMNTGKEVARIRIPAGQVGAMAYSADGRQLAVARVRQHSVDLYDVAAGTRTQTIALPRGRITALCFAPNGKWLAVGRGGDKALIWNLNGSSIYRQLPAGTETQADWTTALAFSADSSQLAVGGLQHVISQWDIATGRKQREYRGHAKQITALAFAADGRTLASSSEEGAIRTWNVATGRETLYFSDNDGYVNAIHFAHHGNALYACLNGGEIREWRAADHTEIAGVPDM